MLARLVDHFQFPLALLNGEGRVIQANSRWMEIMTIFEGEIAYKKINLDPSMSPAASWQQVIDQLPESGEKSSLVQHYSGRWNLFFSKVKFDQSLFFWARPELDTSSNSDEDTNKLAHEKRLHDMGEMAAGIAHEITNPLTVIAAKAAILEYMIKEDHFRGAKSEFLKISQVITQQCLRITKIVRAMRTFSRDGAYDPMVAMSVFPLVDEALALCVEKSRLKGIKFQLESTDSEVRVLCRPIHVVQIMVNLFNNAIDATANTPLPMVTVNFQKCGDFLEIKTSDNGPGVPDEIADKIFNPFYTTKEVGKGTGLGLSLSLRLSQISGGNLALDRKQGKSCFVLKLPLSIA